MGDRLSGWLVCAVVTQVLDVPSASFHVCCVSIQYAATSRAMVGHDLETICTAVGDWPAVILGREGPRSLADVPVPSGQISRTVFPHLWQNVKSMLLLCCAVLCCAVLCCAVLCCAVLCCAVLR